MRITRNIAVAETEKHDVIVVGGGIYGVMLLLQAADQGLKALLLERDDFGAATSYNSLRVIHGGLRYLQSLDMPRFHESVAERKWFLGTFPELVKPMPCMMPLYGRGARRPAILRMALAVNDWLSRSRNRGVPPDNAIPNGRILDIDETRERFPGVVTDGLAGSALWYDAHAPDTQRILIETLKWACGLGAQALNYLEVTELLQSGDRVAGVRATNRITGTTHEFRAGLVVNAAGSASREISRRFDRDIPSMFRPSRAWNILFDRPAPSSIMMALTPDRAGARTYFLHPWKGRLLAGTGHAPAREAGNFDPTIDDSLIREFVDDINLVVPGAELSASNIVRVLSGCLPATGDNSATLTKRAVIHDHGARGGSRGLFSVAGIKFTTARREAARVIGMMMGKSPSLPGPRPACGEPHRVTTIGYDWMPAAGETAWKDELRRVIETESPLRLSDLVYRRTAIGDNPDRTRILSPEIADLFGWTESHRHSEIADLLAPLDSAT